MHFDTDMRRRLWLSVMLLTAACGNAGPPGITVTRPSPSVTVAQPGSGVISGFVVGNQDRVPVGGARLRANGTTLVTEADGEFRLTGLPIGLVQYELSAPQHLTHVSQLNVVGTREGVAIDLIPDAEPFSLGFYRQFARDGFDSPAVLRATNRWTIAPSFYMRTVTDDLGEAVAPEILAGIRRVILNSVPELSGGRFTVAAFETGADARPTQPGWVIVTFFSRFPTANVIGDSSVGGNAGRMRLAYDATLLEPRIDCNAGIVAVADHEIVHTMGFWHTGPPTSPNTDFDFQSVGCTGSGRKDRTRYHAAVVYSRPPGNIDPDIDPENFGTLQPDATLPRIISCTASDVGR